MNMKVNDCITLNLKQLIGVNAKAVEYIGIGVLVDHSRLPFPATI